MIQLVEKMNCTGCGACAFVCASKSIIMKADSIGQVYPVINTDSCIECASCSMYVLFLILPRNINH